MMASLLRSSGRCVPLIAFLMTTAPGLSAAILPLSPGLEMDPAGPRASFAPPPFYSTVTGKWVGRTRSGHDVSIDLTVADGAIAGSASLSDLVADASKPLRVSSLSLTGQTLVFRVKATPCGRDGTYGILTFVSSDSARLDLQSPSAPVTLVLSKVS